MIFCWELVFEVRVGTREVRVIDCKGIRVPDTFTLAHGVDRLPAKQVPAMVDKGLLR